MQYIADYVSPLGNIVLAADDLGLTGVWLEGQKYFANGLEKTCVKKEHSSITKAKQWLDCYFSGQEPEIVVPFHMIGTPFQKEVWEILRRIPYGQTTTYGTIAKQIAQKRGCARMSAQAVGGAVGHNPISILVPCHRVVATNGSLTGYASGLDKKIALLTLENVPMDAFFVPKKGSAL